LTRAILFFVLGTTALFPTLGESADPSAVHVRNFGQVNNHLYRGGQPDEKGLRELAGLHILLDVDLREAGTAAEAERRIAESLGMKYVNVPFRGWGAPTPEQVRTVLALITPDDAGRVFVHCRRGKDRTGTVIACYRIQHDGWDTKRAETEANQYGMSRAERGMRSFIEAFRPMDLPTAQVPEK
jgi:tyrosine-protein phosphatase SIW14